MEKLKQLGMFAKIPTRLALNQKGDSKELAHPKVQTSPHKKYLMLGIAFSCLEILATHNHFEQFNFLALSHSHKRLSLAVDVIFRVCVLTHIKYAVSFDTFCKSACSMHQSSLSRTEA